MKKKAVNGINFFMSEADLSQKNVPQERPDVPNTLAERYASTPMLNVFSPKAKNLFERDFWITIMKGQAALGMDIPQNVIRSYVKVRNNLDLESIKRRERTLRHDEQAKIQEFNELAGYQEAHKGLTTRDHEDNVEQFQYKRGMMIVRDHAVATLVRFGRLAVENGALVMADRTHLGAAQPSLAGKIFSNFGEEMLIGFNNLETLIEEYPLRGIKGATGTQTDQLQLFGGDQEKVDQLEKRVARALGFKNVLGSVGQIYPRSLDFQVTAALFQIITGPSSFAETSRMMAAAEIFTEGFKEGQVGSTAMPHKMNARTSERIKSLKRVVLGNVMMMGQNAGEQAFGGDVTDSAARRVAMADSFFATDGILEAAMTVLDECGFYPAMLQREMNRYLPFLTTTRLLTAAIKEGVGRETAHAVIRDHAVAVAINMRKNGTQENDLLDRLAADTRLGVSKKVLADAISAPIEFVGNAPRQITKFAGRVEAIRRKYPEAAKYNPEPIL